MKVRSKIFCTLLCVYTMPVGAMSMLGHRSITIQPTRIHHNQKRTLHIRQLNGAELPHAVEKCPVAGSVLLASGYVQNLYRYGDENSPTVQLVRRLFHEHENIFAPSISKSSPALSITPERSAQLIKSLDTPISEKDREKIITQWRADHKKISEGEQLTKSQVIRVLDLLQAAKKERASRVYPYPVLPWIISGFTAAKAQSHSEIEQYLTGIGHPKRVSDYDADTLINECKGHMAMAQFEGAPWKALINDKGHSVCVAHILNHDGYITSKLPPMIENLSCGFKGQPTVTTCQEDALRSLINCFVYNPEERKYDYTRVPTVSVVHPDLKSFYTNNSSIDTQGGHEAAQAWMDIVSGLPGIEYCAGQPDARYELQPSIKNVFNLLNRLLCNNTARDFTDLGTKLSSNSRPVTFTVAQESDYRGTIQCLIRGSKIVMYITRGHAYCEFPDNRAQVQRIEQDDRWKVFKRSLNSETDNRTLCALMQVACFNPVDYLFESESEDEFDNLRTLANSALSYQQFNIFANQLHHASNIALRTSCVLYPQVIDKNSYINPEFIAQMKRLIERGYGSELRAMIMRLIESQEIQKNHFENPQFKDFLGDIIADHIKENRPNLGLWVELGLHTTGVLDRSLTQHGPKLLENIIRDGFIELLKLPALNLPALINTKLIQSNEYPLEYAVRTSNAQVVAYLLKIDSQWRNRNIIKALFNLIGADCPSRWERMETIAQIFKENNYAYIPKTPGGTLLHDIACRHVHFGDDDENTVRFLARIIRIFDIDPQARDASGRTALEIVQEQHPMRCFIVKKLEEARNITESLFRKFYFWK